ncbi:MAG: Unknown protein [uncultured Sulfurovum sp.]|uniref:Thioredoxin-like fold domain-containing protein n=1 Tax=uncultured Sulfurovum sp. TaxID=269237 RepID=A0A6S6SXE2_9BACT|nr:MAG: Unknown protein [uncultured Sulfurovum sp.]
MNKTPFNYRKYAISLLFCMTSLFATPQAKQLLSPEDTLKLIETIKDDAIILGNGVQEIHIFIDPLCKMSQRYLKLLYKRNNEIFSEYTIYLYLNELKAKKSKKHILNIIHSESKERILCDIMLGTTNTVLEKIRDKETENIFQEISKVAKKIGVYKRPYIIINGKAK